MDSMLLKLQNTMLEMLKLVDQICRENDIRYSLYAGTLLGAVRHNGFIPWDDDLDVIMTRDNYERFINTWNKLSPKGYVLQNKENSPSFPSSFSKIRKEHTTYISYEWEKDLFHTGVFIDIFPLDRIPHSKLKKMIFKYQCIKYQIYTRENYHVENNWAIKSFISIIMKITSFKKRMRYRDHFIDKLKTIDNDRTLNCIAIEKPSTLGMEYPPDIADDYVELKFEGDTFLCFKKWHEYLTIKFGDYMTLPPEDERSWQHHPLVLDFDHSWDELALVHD